MASWITDLERFKDLRKVAKQVQENLQGPNSGLWTQFHRHSIIKALIQSLKMIMEILYRHRVQHSAGIGTMDCKVHGTENPTDIMKIEHHLMTECYMNKLKGSFACLLTVCSLKVKCSM